MHQIEVRQVTENSDEDGSEPRIRIGREIRRWRKSRALTLAHVSEASGLNLGYLSQIENEKAVPSLDALVAIAGADVARDRGHRGGRRDLTRPPDPRGRRAARREHRRPYALGR
jgi:transcriptional regulator with XRE-family HTH domain